MNAMRDADADDIDRDNETLSLPPSEQIAYHAYINERSKFLDGRLYVGDNEFSPSDILRVMSASSYRDGYPEFQRARQEEVLESVSNGFPTPIAYWCHMFNKAFDSEIQRWLFLKDTWESTIRFLHALIVADVRLSEYKLKPTKASDFNDKGLLSDSMDKLLDNIETIIKQAHEGKWHLDTFALLGKGSPNQLRTLNRLRNTFAHNQTPNELQAQVWTNRSQEVLIHVFMQMDRVREMSLIRFRRYDGVNHLRLRCEPFFGSSTNPDRIDLDVAESTLGNARLREPPYLSPSNILVYWDSQILCLSPFLHFRETPHRHGSQLCMFKRTRQLESGDRMLEYEVLGESDHELFPRETFEKHLISLKAIFEDSPQ